jgi:hypothetical protein
MFLLPAVPAAGGRPARGRRGSRSAEAVRGRDGGAPCSLGRHRVRRCGAAFREAGERFAESPPCGLPRLWPPPGGRGGKSPPPRRGIRMPAVRPRRPPAGSVAGRACPGRRTCARRGSHGAWDGPSGGRPGSRRGGRHGHPVRRFRKPFRPGSRPVRGRPVPKAGPAFGGAARSLCGGQISRGRGCPSPFRRELSAMRKEVRYLRQYIICSLVFSAFLSPVFCG